MFASYHWPWVTVSMLSAIKSLLWREYRMPLVPIEIPSLDVNICLVAKGNVPDTDGIELVAYETSFLNSLFDLSSQGEKMHITWIAFIPTTINARHRTTYTLQVNSVRKKRVPGDPNLCF
jgi:hypothetical protein